MTDTPDELVDDLRIADNPDESRYEAYLDGQVAGYSEYVMRHGRIMFTHTVVDPELEGRGIGSQLVREELDDVRRRGLMVIAKCPFVRAYIQRHPEYQDLLVAPNG